MKFPIEKICKRISKFTILIVIFVIPLFGFSVWFISEPARASNLDRYILYYVDDLFRYNHIKMALYDHLVLLNPYLKLGYGLVYRCFLYFIPLGISSLRILNSIFSIGILFFIYKITKKLGFSDTCSAIAVLLTLTFPVYFLVSISTLAEVMFTFFLILSIYLLYSQRYFLSAIAMAFLPTIRQEGVIFLLLWVFLLPKRFKLKYGLLLPVPFLTWGILNSVLLKHTFFYTFFPNVPDHATPESVASLSQFLRMVRIFSIHPMFITSFIGVTFSYRDSKYRYIFVCFISYVIILLIVTILHLLDAHAFPREIRFLVPIIPFMGTYGALAIGRLFTNKKLKICILLSSIIILPFITIYQIKAMQNDPAVLADSVSEEEELAIKKLGTWLIDFARERNIRGVYFLGEKSIHKVYRRLWMYLPGNIKYYPIIGEMESLKPKGRQPLDMATLTIAPLEKNTKGIFIAEKPYEKNNGPHNASYVLLKEEPLLSLYIYLMQYDGEV